MITTKEEYDNCKAQIARQTIEVSELTTALEEAQAMVDATAELFETFLEEAGAI
jgi:hypothetical protein